MRVVQRPSGELTVSIQGNPKKCRVVWELRETYSNFKAAIELGNPVTSTIISQGRRFSRDVRTAPPLASPLCCLSRLGGFGVDPTYKLDLLLTVERKT
jgi:hypothetical protein